MTHHDINKSFFSNSSYITGEGKTLKGVHMKEEMRNKRAKYLTLQVWHLFSVLGVDGLWQQRVQVDAHLLLTVLFILHLKKQKCQPTENVSWRRRRFFIKLTLLYIKIWFLLLPVVTSLRSSETSLAWAVSKVSGSRWNRLEEWPFFRAVLYFSWTQTGAETIIHL